MCTCDRYIYTHRYVYKYIHVYIYIYIHIYLRPRPCRPPPVNRQVFNSRLREQTTVDWQSAGRMIFISGNSYLEGLEGPFWDPFGDPGIHRATWRVHFGILWVIRESSHRPPGIFGVLDWIL